MNERTAQTEVEPIDVELSRLGREINDLLARPLIAEDVEGAIEWRASNSGRRRAAVKTLIHPVAIGPWPGRAKRTSPRWRGEHEVDYTARRARDALAILEQRVQIVWHWERV